MTHVIASVNQKGSAGKSPTAVHLSFALSKAGYKVLFIDLDSQATASFHFLGKQYKNQNPTIYNALISLDIIHPIQIKDNLHLLPAHDELEKAEVELTAKKGLFYQARLKQLLEQYPQYDFCVIDTPGSRVSVMSTIALTAAHQVVVPVKTELAHVEATIDTMNLIEDVQSGLNPQLKIWGVIANQFESSSSHHKEAVELLKETYQDLLYPEVSKKATKYNDALAMRVDIRELEPLLGEYWDKIAASLIEKGGVRP